jgi:TrmH family RNA methyltransferase
VNLRIVLVAPRNPLNIGAAARAMSNFGISELALVKPYDVAFREARSAVRAHYILEAAQVYSTLGEAIAGCGLVIGTTAGGKRDLHLPLYPLEAAAGLIAERDATAPVALLFGSEKFGLSNEDMSHCHWLLRIPTRDEHASMNLGQAVAICLYELRRSDERAATRFPAPAEMSSGDAERITELLNQILTCSGYVQERTAGSSELKLRRLVRRLGLPERDVETWLGMLRQILWKVKAGQ